MYETSGLLHSSFPNESHAHVAPQNVQPVVIFFFITDNPGFCPIVDPMVCSGYQEDSCFDDASCEDNEKCCHDGCRKLCVKPLPKPNAAVPRKAIARKYSRRIAHAPANQDDLNGCPGSPIAVHGSPISLLLELH